MVPLFQMLPFSKKVSKKSTFLISYVCHFRIFSHENFRENVKTKIFFITPAQIMRSAVHSKVNPAST